MKFLVTLIAAITLIFAGWAYYNLMELTAALIENDNRELALRVDLERIRAQHAAALSQPFRPSNLPKDHPVQKGIDAVGATVADTVIDMEWVRGTLSRPTNGRLGWPSFAFFDSPMRLLLRYGELGESPVHAYMALRDWQWRLIEIHE